MTEEYRKSLTELDLILNYMNPVYLSQLPNKLKTFIKENLEPNYKPKIDKKLPLASQKIKKNTQILISMLYRSYWCDIDTKEFLSQNLQINELGREKIESNQIYFNNIEVHKENHTAININPSVLPTKLQKQNWFQKMIKGISRCFIKIFK